MSRYDVGGHAAEHVALAAAAWLEMTVVVIGNLRVVDDLVQEGYAFTPTSTVPDIADHSLANSSISWAVAAALVLVAAFRWRDHIGDAATEAPASR